MENMEQLRSAVIRVDAFDDYGRVDRHGDNTNMPKRDSAKLNPVHLRSLRTGE